METIQKSGGGEGSLMSSLDELSGHTDDERWTTFVEHLQNAAYTNPEAEEGQQDDHHATEENNEMVKQAAKDAAGTDINVNSFEELRLSDDVVQAANDVWRLFIS